MRRAGLATPGEPVTYRLPRRVFLRTQAKKKQLAQVAVLVLRRDADATKEAPAGRLRSKQIFWARPPCSLPKPPAGQRPSRAAAVTQTVSPGYPACNMASSPWWRLKGHTGRGAAFGGCAVFSARISGGIIVRQSSVHRSQFPGWFQCNRGPAILSCKREQVGGNAGHVVVFMPRRAEE